MAAWSLVLPSPTAPKSLTLAAAAVVGGFGSGPLRSVTVAAGAAGQQMNDTSNITPRTMRSPLVGRDAASVSRVTYCEREGVIAGSFVGAPIAICENA